MGKQFKTRLSGSGAPFGMALLWGVQTYLLHHDKAPLLFIAVKCRTQPKGHTHASSHDPFPPNTL